MKGYFMAKNNFVVELIFKECHLLKKRKITETQALKYKEIYESTILLKGQKSSNI